MAEIRINATGGVKLYDADDSHYAQIIAGTITSNVNAITLGHDVVSIVDNLALTSDSAVLKFGADNDTTLTHTDGTGLTLNSTNKLCFNDATQFVQGISGTVLGLGATDEIDLTATAVDLNGTLDVSGNSQFSGTITVGVDDTGLDVKMFGASAGSYALWDESANLLDLRGATAAGPGNLKLTTGELTVVDADVLGKIEFQAPLEASGTDAILVGASIWAEADDTFAAGVNNTDLVFALGKSEAAAEKFRFTADTEIGIGGANYGTDGQVLTSGGAGAAVAWEDASGAVTALNNATANELVTIGSTTTELDAESTLTYDGTTLALDSGRIKFPATASVVDEANTLDDYEEGEWTPVLLGRDTAGTWTANDANSGEYLKIGKTVWLWFWISGDLASPSGELRMSGIPFNMSGNNAGGNRGQTYRIMCDGNSFDGETPTNANKLTDTTAEFYYHNGTRSATGVTLVNSSTADLGASDVYLWGHITYKTTQ